MKADKEEIVMCWMLPDAPDHQRTTSAWDAEQAPWKAYSARSAQNEGLEPYFGAPYRSLTNAKVKSIYH